MITCHDCGDRWPGTQSHGGHCTKCHITFGNNNSFDRHIEGRTLRHMTEAELHERNWQYVEGAGWYRQYKNREVW